MTNDFLSIPALSLYPSNSHTESSGKLNNTRCFHKYEARK